MKLKELRNLVRLGIARDVTFCRYEDLPSFEILVITHGVYGMNGCLMREIDSGNLMVILSRNSLLFQCV